MPGDENYEQWRKARAKVEVPGGFADRVMAAVESREREVRESVACGLLISIVRSRLSRAAICSVAAAACLLRIGCLISTFIVF